MLLAQISINTLYFALPFIGFAILVLCVILTPSKK